MLYSISKLANCMHAKYLSDYFQNQSDERLRSVKVFAIRPGFVRGTELGRHTPWILRKIAAPVIWLIAKNLDQGVEGIVHCATTDLDQLDSGKMYFGENNEDFEESVTKTTVEELVKMTEELIKKTEGNALDVKIDESGDH